MHLRIVAVGKLRDPSIAALAHEFQKRLGAYHRLEVVEVPASRGNDSERAMREEAERVLKRVQDDALWLLDRSGVELSSEDLSRKITDLELQGNAKLSLVVCGTFGAAPELRKRARFLWSLSKLTFLHEWARLLVLEQLYRAAKIARGEPYHH